LTVFGEELEWEADLTVVEGEPTGLVQLDPFVSGFLGRLSGWTLSTLTADDDWEESGTSLRELAERWCGIMELNPQSHSLSFDV
jgi:hypothetical protein